MWRFRALISLSVRLHIAGGARSGSVERALAEAARNVSDGKISTTADLLADLDPVSPNDREFEGSVCCRSCEFGEAGPVLSPVP